nr:putative uncharacterized protein DDB_G0271606 [Lytechinus pictus]
MWASTRSCEVKLKASRAAEAVAGCKQCEDGFTSERKQGDSNVIQQRSGVTASSYLSREGCLSISSSSSAGEEGVLREPWRGSSGLDQVTLSPLGNSLSSGDTSDDNVTRLGRQKVTKPHRKHVRISDQGSDGAGSGQLKLPSQRGSSLPRMNRDKGSSSEEIGEVCSGRLKHPQSRLGMRGKLVSPRVASGRLSSSDEGTGAGGRLVCRQRNESDSSHDSSEDSGSLGEKSKQTQMRRPASRMQRPRQIQRPKASQQQCRKPDGSVALDGRGNQSSRLQKPTSYHKGDGKGEQTKAVPPQEQQGSLEWQQLQLQQQQDKLHKQHQAAHKQQQENQQRLHSQQQQLQKNQQEKVSANLQKQQEILVEQQQQQLKRQQLMQQHHMWQQQQQKSQELAMPKIARTQGMITKRSSNQDLTSSQQRSPETIKTTQELRHSSPDLIDNKLSSTQHTATVHTQEKQNGADKQCPKSRLPAPSSRLPSSRQPANGAVKRDTGNPTQTKNIANGMPVHKSKMSSPKSPRRTIPASNAPRLQKGSPPPEKRIPGVMNSAGVRQPAVQLQCNQNNNPTVAPRGQVQTTTLTTTTTTITTTTLPQGTSKLPSPVKSNIKPPSRLAQPKVKVHSKIPKGSGIPMKSRDAN